MIDVHYWPPPNGWKVTIFLEEAGLKCRGYAVGKELRQPIAAVREEAKKILFSQTATSVDKAAATSR